LFAGGVVVYRDIPEELRSLIEPVVEHSGFELVDLAVQRGRAPWYVRVIIDTPQMDGRVPVDRCASVSREIETQLDAGAGFPASYSLEVSSPGLDRMLAREKDFEAATGSEVRIETRRPQDGRRRFRGRLLAFSGGVAKLDVDGAEVGIQFAEVAKANTVYHFTAADFSRRSQ
jgi:ribosome maturation factor RimP